MLSENLKNLRKIKGITQEELAIRLNVVRQTISKWEKGLSVPDADTLIKLADFFEVSVSELLGSTVEKEVDSNIIADQLSRINEQLAAKNRRSHRIWKTIGIIFVIFIVVNILLVLLGTVSFYSFKSDKTTTLTTESEIITNEEE
ncbi:MAG: helix-turn-helix transcriptional regulator [Clostridiales bacterium]|nr:helix-turn-helix transcriptional regulator [uncultured Anaerosporobacter sp.]MBS5934753.1 helix-turn-helix transcriptional regulator [Clostridiales bacterium]